MSGHDVIVIGASVGGVEALSKLAKALPDNLPAAIFAVLHVPTSGISVMPSILNRVGVLKALHPQDGDEIQPGHIYMAPPNYHLLVKPGHIHLSQSPKENGHRPAIDPLFRTAAQSYGQRVVGVVLSGMLDDGTAGLMAIKACGGLAIVQSPDDAFFPGMPQSAIGRVAVDRILPLDKIADALVQLAHTPVAPDREAAPSNGHLEFESKIADIDMAAVEADTGERPGMPSGFGCPTCGGALWELNEHGYLRFRCRIGHAWSEDNLMAIQSEAIEEALWVALKALEERAALSLRLAGRANDRNQARVSARFEDEARQVKQQAELIRQLLLKGLKSSFG